MVSAMTQTHIQSISSTMFFLLLVSVCSAVRPGTLHQHIFGFSPAERNNRTFVWHPWKFNITIMFYQRHGLFCRSRATLTDTIRNTSAAWLLLTIDKAPSGVISASNLKSEPTDLWHSLVRHWIGMLDRWICNFFYVQIRRWRHKDSN